MKTPEYLELPREKAIDQISNNDIEKTVDFITSTHRKAWRGAWLLRQAMYNNDKVSVDEQIKTICIAIKNKPSNQQRELLRLIEASNISKENEGIVFDQAVSCWEDFGNKGSTRVVGLRLALRIAENYPTLKQEILRLCEDRYLDGLSPGIKHSVRIMIRSIKND